MNTSREKKSQLWGARFEGYNRIHADMVVCFICHRFVPIKDTIELDHATGRFKVRVCKKHLEV